MKAFMFPGQGAQAKGMGGTLFDEFPELTKKADKILGYSIKELCLEDPRNELGNTQFTQPALYVVSALSFLKKSSEPDYSAPDFLAGHSLGEFNALQAAGVFTFESGLKIVKKRGELMSEAEGGGMAAVVNATKDEIETILKDNGLESIDLANYNSPSQIVISGRKDDIDKAKPLFQTGKMLFYPLNTSGAFHSRYMVDAKAKFENYLRKFKLKPTSIPVISNVTAEPYKDDEIFDNITSQLTSSVKWSDSVIHLLDKGEIEFVELGHGMVLTKLVNSIRRDLKKAAKQQTKVEDKPKAAAKSAKSEPKKAEEAKAVAPVAKGVTVEKGLSAGEKVSFWNKNCPVGTKVKSTFTDYDDLETSSEAVVLFGHRAAVYMKGYNGYFDIDELVTA